MYSLCSSDGYLSTFLHNVTHTHSHYRALWLALPLRVGPTPLLFSFWTLAPLRFSTFFQDCGSHVATTDVAQRWYWQLSEGKRAGRALPEQRKMPESLRQAGIIIFLPLSKRLVQLLQLFFLKGRKA